MRKAWSGCCGIFGHINKLFIHIVLASHNFHLCQLAIEINLTQFVVLRHVQRCESWVLAGVIGLQFPHLFLIRNIIYNGRKIILFYIAYRSLRERAMEAKDDEKMGKSVKYKIYSTKYTFLFKQS